MTSLLPASLELSDVSFRTSRGHILLHAVDFEIPFGTLVSIVGPNGAGKSTLLRVLAGLLPPTSGTVTLNGTSIYDLNIKERSRIFAYLAQFAEVDSRLKIRDLIELGMTPTVHRLDEISREERLQAALLSFGLAEKANRRLSQISGGELQRAGLARCLAQSTPFIFLDEPTSNLDPAWQIRAMKEVKSSQSTVVTVVHDLNSAIEYSDVVILMNEGRAIGTGNPRSVLSEDSILKTFHVTSAVVTSETLNKSGLLIGDEKLN
ncbi:MAG: ABC transporter ATP-binding protein [Roseovarius confluentis]|uniref:ABC transporter ATP-binding protein n=1 Tax=Roseovarius sp. TaxID=1486281 RepID=UPI0032F0918C